MCDNCEANEILLKIHTKRLLWIEDLLSEITDGLSIKYLNTCNDFEKATEHNMSGHILETILKEKQKIRERLTLILNKYK